MIKKLLREMYLLPRGEQRALVGVSLLLLLSLLLRIGVQLLPGREPAGVEEFEKEARAMMAAFAQADSMDRVRPIRSSYATRTKQYQTVDINRADSAQLLPLPGIGPVFAGRIIKYRRLLGGFVSVNQLAEVYGMPMETLDLIRNRVHIDTSVIRKIRLDSATFKELLRHPYLEYEEVKALVEYRDFKGNISSGAELEENLVLADSILERVGPYIDFSE